MTELLVALCAVFLVVMGVRPASPDKGAVPLSPFMGGKAGIA